MRHWEQRPAEVVIVGHVGTNLRYGLAHEFGMVIMHPGSHVRNAKSLHWVSAGKDVFAMWTRPHPIKMPERSFLRSALTDRSDAFRAAVNDTVRRIVVGGGR